MLLVSVSWLTFLELLPARPGSQELSMLEPLGIDGSGFIV